MSKTSAPCPKCQTPLSFTFQEAQCVNLPTVSMIVMEHTAATCKGCGRTWMPLMSAPALACTQLSEVQPKSDILPATSMPTVPPPGTA